MNIIWQYLDKRSAAVNALKDYSSMAYILAHTDEEIAQVHEDTTTLGSPAFTDMPGGSPNPQSGEMRIIAAIDEIDVLRERYRQLARCSPRPLPWNPFARSPRKYSKPGSLPRSCYVG